MERLLPSEYGPQEIPLDADQNFVVLNGNCVTSDFPGVHMVDFNHVPNGVPGATFDTVGTVLEDSV